MGLERKLVFDLSHSPFGSHRHSLGVNSHLLAPPKSSAFRAKARRRRPTTGTLRRLGFAAAPGKRATRERKKAGRMKVDIIGRQRASVMTSPPQTGNHEGPDVDPNPYTLMREWGSSCTRAGIVSTTQE